MALDDTHLATGDVDQLGRFLDYVRGTVVRKVEGIGDDDPDGDLRVEPGETLAGLLADYARACDESRAVLAGHGLDEQTVNHSARGPVTLRWICLHMIEETARHAGHIDILREQLDGVVGD
jgi:hypothetical protein